LVKTNKDETVKNKINKTHKINNISKINTWNYINNLIATQESIIFNTINTTINNYITKQPINTINNYINKQTINTINNYITKQTINTIKLIETTELTNIITLNIQLNMFKPYTIINLTIIPDLINIITAIINNVTNTDNNINKHIDATMNINNLNYLYLDETVIIPKTTCKQPRKYKRKKEQDLLICKVCGKKISKFNFAKHIKQYHNLDEYIKKYGEFRKSKQGRKSNNKISRITCKLCGKEYSSVGIATHLKDTHYMTTDEYIKKYGEYRPWKLKKLQKIETYKNNNTTGDRFTCLICNEPFYSDFALSHHIRTIHKMSKQDYLIKYYFKGNVPLCKCGCGNPVKVVDRYPYCNKFIKGHTLKGKNSPSYGMHHSLEVRKKMSAIRIKYIQSHKGIFTDTKPELEFKQWLEKYNIKYIHQYRTKYGLVDFYIPENDLYIEIDGEYWHPIIKENLNFQLISNFIGELNRAKLNNLIRLRTRNNLLNYILNNCKNISDLIKYSVTPNLNIKYNQVLITKEYLKDYIENTPLVAIKKRSEKLLVLIRLLWPEFKDLFNIMSTKETPNMIINSIRTYNFSKIISEKNKIFKNNCWAIGNTFLKQHHYSYWKSSYYNNTPEELYNDDDKLQKIIDYRIGINHLNDISKREVFDFSAKAIINGISAIRGSISFFKPLLASSIYDYFIDSKIKNPVVFDTCIGFSGRLIGFMSLYPNGVYYGCEPNIETFNETKEIIKLFGFNENNIHLYNCKVEDFDLSIIKNEHIDLTFTSIPYYNTETYSNDFISDYKNLDDWYNKFVKYIINNFDNVILNISNTIGNKLINDYKLSDDNIYYLQNNISHFKLDRTNNKKFEYILKF